MTATIEEQRGVKDLVNALHDMRPDRKHAKWLELKLALLISNESDGTSTVDLDPDDDEAQYESGIRRIRGFLPPVGSTVVIIKFGGNYVIIGSLDTGSGIEDEAVTVSRVSVDGLSYKPPSGVQETPTGSYGVWPTGLTKDVAIPEWATQAFAIAKIGQAYAVTNVNSTNVALTLNGLPDIGYGANIVDLQHFDWATTDGVGTDERQDITLANSFAIPEAMRGTTQTLATVAIAAGAGRMRVDTVSSSTMSILFMGDIEGLILGGGGSGGPFLSVVEVKAADYTAAVQEFVPVDVSAGSVDITLPTAPSAESRVGVKVVGTGGGNSVLVHTGGTDRFNQAGGPDVLEFSNLNSGFIAQYHGGVWYVFGEDLPQGSLYLMPTSTKTGAYSALAGQLVPCDTSAGVSFPVSLPATPPDGTLVGVNIVDWDVADPAGVSIVCSGDDVMQDGTTDALVRFLNEGMVLQYTGGVWYRISNSLPVEALDDRYGANFHPTALKTANYTAIPQDWVPVDATAGDIVITLPNSPPNGSQVGARKYLGITANTVTVACAGSDVFDIAGGSTTAVLTNINEAIWLQYNDGIWYVLMRQVTPGTGSGTFIAADENNAVDVFVELEGGLGAFNTGPLFQINKKTGGVAKDDFLGLIGFGGYYNATDVTSSAASVIGEARQNWNSTKSGAALAFWATKNDSISSQKVGQWSTMGAKVLNEYVLESDPSLDNDGHVGTALLVDVIETQEFLGKSSTPVPMSLLASFPRARLDIGGSVYEKVNHGLYGQPPGLQHSITYANMPMAVLRGDIASPGSMTTVPVYSTKLWPGTGTAWISALRRDGFGAITAVIQIKFTYTGKTETSFTGVTVLWQQALLGSLGSISDGSQIRGEATTETGGDSVITGQGFLNAPIIFIGKDTTFPYDGSAGGGGTSGHMWPGFQNNWQVGFYDGPLIVPWGVNKSDGTPDHDNIGTIDRINQASFISYFFNRPGTRTQRRFGVYIEDSSGGGGDHSWRRLVTTGSGGVSVRTAYTGTQSLLITNVPSDAASAGAVTVETSTGIAWLSYNGKASDRINNVRCVSGSGTIASGAAVQLAKSGAGLVDVQVGVLVGALEAHGTTLEPLTAAETNYSFKTAIGGGGVETQYGLYIGHYGTAGVFNPQHIGIYNESSMAQVGPSSFWNDVVFGVTGTIDVDFTNANIIGFSLGGTPTFEKLIVNPVLTAGELISQDAALVVGGTDAPVNRNGYWQLDVQGGIHTWGGPLGLSFTATEWKGGNPGLAAKVDLRSSRGTPTGSAGALASGDVIGGIHFGGDDGYAIQADSAMIFAVTTEAWNHSGSSNTHAGSKLDFYTTPDGPVTGKRKVLTLDQDASATFPGVIYANAGLIGVGVYSMAGPFSNFYVRNMPGAAVAANASLGALIAEGQTHVVGSVGQGTMIQSLAEATWTTSSTPGRIEFSTVTTGSTSLVNRMTVESSGNVTIENHLTIGGNGVGDLWYSRAGGFSGYYMENWKGSALVNNDAMGTIFWRGSYNASNNIGNGAWIQGFATGTWSSSSTPGRLEFYTTPSGSLTPTLRMTILSTGVVSIPGTLDAAGGVDAPNINFGDSDLDGYKEGTYTPSLVGETTLGSVTYTSRYGRYTRIGDVVHFYCEMVINSLSTAAGNVIVTLPYAISPTPATGHGFVLDINTSNTAIIPQSARGVPGNANTRLMHRTAAAAGPSITQVSNLASGAAIRITGWYHTDAAF